MMRNQVIAITLTKYSGIKTLGKVHSPMTDVTFQVNELKLQRKEHSPVINNVVNQVDEAKSLGKVY